MAGKWIQKASRKMEAKGTKGSFTKWAHAHGFKDSKSASRHVMAHKDKYSPAIIKKANFARNVT
jgi:hypothetical protein